MAVPKDAQAMADILKEMGVSDYEPRVINQLLEFSYRYVSDVLDDARAFSEHGGKKQIDEDDVKLAIRNKVDNTFSQPPPRDVLLELAKQRNAAPLPPIKQPSGLRLPPDRFCLLQPNYRLKGRLPSAPTHVRALPTEPNVAALGRQPRTATAAAPDESPQTVVQRSEAAGVGASGGPVFRLVPAAARPTAKRKYDEAGFDEDYDR